MLDSLDIRVMRELFRGGQSVLFVDQRKSLRNIAAKLGVDKETVRTRILRFREKGFLTGWLAFANPNLFGVRQTVLTFDVSSAASKDDLIRRIRLIQGVVLIGNFYGTSMLVIIYHESEQSLRKVIRLISRISGAENLFSFENAFPECSVTLSRADWKIIRSLHEDPLKSRAVISKDTGLSTRTVKRRLTRLVEGKALVVLPKLDFKALDGTATNLVVTYVNPERRREIDERILSHFDDYIFRIDLSQKRHALFMLIIPNVARAREISTWMRDLPGVSSYRVDLFQERIELWQSYHELLERKLAEIPSQPSRGVPVLRC